MSTVKRNEIQWLRAIAALEVAICHSDLIVKHFSVERILNNDLYQPLAGMGVELFFIVSGYIMCMRAPKIASYKSFIYSRITRIYPMYWLFTTVAVVAALAVPAWQMGNINGDPMVLLRSYLILPGWGFPLLGVGWTLEYEMIFYLLVTAAMAIGLTRGRNIGLLAFLLAVLGLIGCILGQRSSGSALEYRVLSPYMFAFGAGWLFCSLENAANAVRIRRVALFAMIAALAAWIDPEWGGRLIIRISVASAIFLSFIVCRRAFQKDNLINRTVWLIGDASFALYLSHWFVLSACGKVLGAVGLAAHYGDIARILGLLVSVAIGIFFFQYLEKPLNRWLRFGEGRGRGSRPASPARVAVGTLGG